MTWTRTCKVLDNGKIIEWVRDDDGHLRYNYTRISRPDEVVEPSSKQMPDLGTQPSSLPPLDWDC